MPIPAVDFEPLLQLIQRHAVTGDDDDDESMNVSEASDTTVEFDASTELNNKSWLVLMPVLLLWLFLSTWQRKVIGVAAASAYSILQSLFLGLHAPGQDGYPVFAPRQFLRRLRGLPNNCLEGYSTPAQWLANAIYFPLALPLWFTILKGAPWVRVLCPLSSCGFWRSSRASSASSPSAAL